MYGCPEYTNNGLYCRNLPRLRPALNWGMQYKTLVVNAPGDKSKLLRQDLEIVYPGGAVYHGWGMKPAQAVHVMVPEFSAVFCHLLILG